MGGAIFSTAGMLTLTNDTFVSDLAKGGGAGGGVDAATVGQGYGGAVFVRNGSLEATFDTFSSNAVTNGDTTSGTASDLYVLSDGSGNQAKATVVNSILGQNGTTTVSDFYAGIFNSGTAPNLSSSGPNLVSDNPPSPNGLTGTITGGNPNFAAAGLTNNGGPTNTIALSSTSTEAIGKATAGTGITIDQRGDSRKAAPDLGAYETQTVTPTVSVTDHGGPYNGSPYPVTAASVVGLNNTVIASKGDASLAYKYYAGTLTSIQAASATPLPGGAPTSAGNYTVVGVFTSNVAGYSNAVSDADHFSITPVQAKVSITGVSVTYNGNPHPATGTASGVESPSPANLTNLLHLFYSTNGGATFTMSAPVIAGTYEIYYTFDGNTNYLAVSAKSDSGKAVVIAKTTPTITASAGPVVVIGTGVPLSASATLANGVNETGTITFTLYNPGNAQVYTDVVNVPGNGTYTTSAGTSTGSVLPTVAGTYQWVATYSGDGNNKSASTTQGRTSEIAVGAGVTVVGTTLYIVGGNTNDQVTIQHVGSSNTGSTGIQVSGKLNGVNLVNVKYGQPPALIVIVGLGGNDNVTEEYSLVIPVTVSEGNGNNNIQLGQGSNTVTVGNGSDKIQAGRGSNMITAGNGNDCVLLGTCTLPTRSPPPAGNNTVVLGSGNDSVQFLQGNNYLTVGSGNDQIQLADGNNTVQAGNGRDTVHAGNGNNHITVGNGGSCILVGNGSNVIVAGNGNDSIQAGNGNNLIVGGRGHDTIVAGNGNNILIDGSVQLTQTVDTLDRVLSDWTSDIQHGDTAAQIAALITPRLSVTFNTTNPNTISAGKGRDWFWATYAHDHTNRKPTDLLN